MRPPGTSLLYSYHIYFVLSIIVLIILVLAEWEA